MPVTFPGESAEYRVARERRGLPPGGIVPDDHAFQGAGDRHVGTIEPLWNLFDLTPEGRPTDWDEQVAYP